MMYPKKIPHGIMFHHFHGGKHPKTQGSVSEEDLKKILDYIGADRFLSPEAWLDKLAKKNLNPEDLCLTFDDGLLSQLDVALPVLESFGLKAFWFVYSGVFEGRLENMEIYRAFRMRYFDSLDDFYRLFFNRASESGLLKSADPALEERAIKDLRNSFPFYSVNDARFRFLRDKALGRQNYEKLMDAILEEYKLDKADLAKDLWMTNQNLKYLSDSGHSLGLHSYSHPTALADLSFQEQLDEYQKNYSHLERVCGQKPLAMSHPCNSYNVDTLEALRQLGIRCGFRSNMFPNQAGESLNNSDLEIAREDHANIKINY